MSAVDVRFRQRTADRRQIYALVDAGDRTVAYGPLTLEQVERTRY